MHHPVRMRSPRQIPKQGTEPQPLSDEGFSSWAECTERLVLTRTCATIDAFIVAGVLVTFAVGAIAPSGSTGDGTTLASQPRNPLLAEFQSQASCHDSAQGCAGWTTKGASNESGVISGERSGSAEGARREPMPVRAGPGSPFRACGAPGMTAHVDTRRDSTSGILPRPAEAMIMVTSRGLRSPRV
jgi:hypothetical protein